MSDDPIAETSSRISGYLTLALTAAARAAEVSAHRRAQLLREAQRQGQAARRAAEDQLRAEAATARHQLRDVGRTQWWDTADDAQVVNSYALARAYGQTDPELAGTARYMAEEIGRRYGIDADALVASVEEKLAEQRAAGTQPEHRAAAAERAQAAALTAEAHTVDRAVRADGTVDVHERAHDVPFATSGWDDAARREALAERLDAAVPSLPEARQARTVADMLQGKPAAAAPGVAQAAARAPKAHNMPVRGPERTVGR
jgi:hypothetical protein